VVPFFVKYIIMNVNQLISLVLQQRVIPLYYHDDATICLGRMKSLYDAGVRIIEFTNRGDKALSNFSQLVQVRTQLFPDLKLGVGTIFSAVTAESFFTKGADFLVSPSFSLELFAYSKEKQILYIPGCMTPTEISMAVTAGCHLIKIFPAKVVGPSFINSVKELFPTVYFMPTGGIKLTELATWFDYGADAIGVGGPLFSAVSTNGELENKMRELLTQAALGRNE
jgi:2-dehydro-3-deoxyphosphogluconate aldolase/(4S)-4-hydroxy-2-oxoglutarate aldolase